MSEVDNMEWLEAVMNHPSTEDIDLYVAVGLIRTGCANGVTVPSGALIPQADVDQSMALLVKLGFLEQVAAVEFDGGKDSLLVLRMPVVSV